MSAFAVICELSDSNTLGFPSVFHRVMERLSHRGPDGCNTTSVHNIRMGYWHFWTTPEEVGEYQPLKLKNLPFQIVFDGRIDNRGELFALLGISSSESRTISDAALTLQVYARWGEDGFKRLIGEFALVIFDEQRREVVAARDHLGDRTLFYAFFGTHLVIASESWAVAGAYPSKPEINDSTVAHYFAMRVPHDGQTFFENVLELLPAHILKVSAAGHRLWRYWSPDPYGKIRYRTDAEYGDHFRSLLEESIHSRLRSSLPLGVLMSGGLDSTSIACIAARMIAPQTLTTISYVFDELAECDERHYIDSMIEKYGIHSIQVACDDLWVFKDWSNWILNPNRPTGNFYRLILERVHKRAFDEGVPVLLTGYMGDHLYSAGSDWIADLMIDGQFLRAEKELIFQFTTMGWKQTLKTRHLRRAARCAVDSILPGAIRLPYRNSMPVWINPAFQGSLIAHRETNPVFERHGTLLGLATSGAVANSFSGTNRNQIELRNPYRDRRLIEFVLALPAYQLYCQGISKYVLRIAMRGILPDMIRTRSSSTSFVSLYHRGVAKERLLMEFYLKDPSAEWRKFFQPDWISRILQTTHLDGIEGLLPFLCISYETWRRSFA